ncbi:MAG: tRNA (N6-isopentenyl adenosine(37)-C2)-methylthiotransferase MiaB [Dehalococcoidia bacterium]|nr:tRNA (N6-isopentenyl adenosine(37)-C2)-methylthiotransferase MiaB [Dehalococcoidia bacterium]
MNVADSQRLGSALEQLGLRQVGDAQNADVVVFNSCVVRQSAEDKVASALGLMRPLKREQPDKVIALMGCMVGPTVSKEMKRRFPYVDLFMRPQEYKPLLDVVGERLGVDWEGCVGSLAPLQPDVSSYVPIIHGCDLFCSFCIIPYRRGRQMSRTVDEIVWEVQHLVERGVKEVTLLGQTVDAYGLDLAEKPDLADLLTAVHGVSGLQRVRFLTSHPNYMTDRIIKTVADLPKVCELINLPIQAGDDTVLETMRRGYTRADYVRLVDRIRMAMPGVGLHTDIIVGFCGETDEQFAQTVSLLEEVRFDKVHLARYSTRPGTIAERKMVDDVPERVKDERLQVLEKLQTRIATERNAAYLMKTIGVLVDGHESGKWKGRTRTDKLVFFEHPRDLLGKLVDVEVTHTSAWALQGKLAGIQ